MQAELHARGDVLRAPVRLAIGHHGRDGAAEVAGRIGARGQMWPLSRWVCESTNSGSRMRPRERQARRLAEVERAGWRDGGEASLVDNQIDSHEAVAIGRRGRKIDMRAQDARADDRPARRFGDLKFRVQVSRLRALSCQRCSRK